MRGDSVFFLAIAVGLAVSIFLLSMFHTFDGKDAVTSKIISASHALEELIKTDATNMEVSIVNSNPIQHQITIPQDPPDMAGGLHIKPAMIQSTLQQKQFPNMRGVALSSDFAALMEDAKNLPTTLPKRNQKRESTAKSNVNTQKPSHGNELQSSNMTCKETLDQTCKIYPYIRFWNKKFSPADCYQSPLRPFFKEQTPIVDQKFVLFEPDRGGWSKYLSYLRIL